MSKDNAFIIAFSLFCTSVAVVALALTFTVKGNNTGSADLSLVVDRLERLEETLATHDSRRNAQYGELKSLIGDENGRTN